jgi:hypothetical protein
MVVMVVLLLAASGGAPLFSLFPQWAPDTQRELVRVPVPYRTPTLCACRRHLLPGGDPEGNEFDIDVLPPG